MPGWLDEVEEMVLSGRIKVPYKWWVGETGSRFLIALRDEKRILGAYCKACDMVFLPPRKTCGRCFNEMEDRREVGPAGTLVTYTVPAYREDIHPKESPFAFGIIKLDGADTGLTHLVGGFSNGSLKCGMRVEAVFKAERKGNILDIRYFRPVG